MSNKKYVPRKRAPHYNKRSRIVFYFKDGVSDEEKIYAVQKYAGFVEKQGIIMPMKVSGINSKTVTEVKLHENNTLTI